MAHWSDAMKATFTTTVTKDDQVNATGLPVPAEAVASLGTQKRPKVIVSISGHTYRSTVAVFGNVFMLPLSAENREAAGVKAGDQVEVTIELDQEPRTVEVPGDLAAALAEQPGAAASFAALSFTMRKEYVRQVESAKAQETRQRRIRKIVTGLAGEQPGIDI
jgi:bifunctional DNA-binding transcriptional regulator/antitoxin component of YhaV-PrlF toxin-antitoxin module